MTDLVTTDQTADEFQAAETIIERGLHTFVEVGQALLAIREGRGYRHAGYTTFEDYCQERWGISRPNAYRLIDAAQVIGILSPIGDGPTNEAQARELAPLLRTDPGRIPEVWQEAVETAPNGKVTAAHVEEVVERYTQRDNWNDAPSWTEEETDLKATLLGGEAVVINMHRHKALEQWARAEGRFYRIDRQSDWGNPFVIGEDGDRNEVVDNYRDHYLRYKYGLLARIGDLEGKALACWCAPARCHGEVLLEALQGLLEQEAMPCHASALIGLLDE